MKIDVRLYTLMAISFLIIINSCKKDDNSSIEKGTVTDIDGNIYNTVKIGTQVWMAENLKTTKYRDGTSISNVTENTQWKNLTTSAYCNYNNDANNITKNGRLYNWYALNDTRNVAPTGWHVATDAEWATLINYLGGESFAGGKLKETGTSNWLTPNTGATNEVGFTTFPSGYRDDWGTFYGIGSYSNFWTATDDDALNAWSHGLGFDHSNIYRNSFPKTGGFSIRCVKD